MKKTEAEQTKLAATLFQQEISPVYSMGTGLLFFNIPPGERPLFERKLQELGITEGKKGYIENDNGFMVALEALAPLTPDTRVDVKREVFLSEVQATLSLQEITAKIQAVKQAIKDSPRTPRRGR